MKKQGYKIYKNTVRFFKSSTVMYSWFINQLINFASGIALGIGVAVLFILLPVLFGKLFDYDDQGVHPSFAIMLKNLRYLGEL
jgi:hypothetical protein